MASKGKARMLPVALLTLLPVEPAAAGDAPRDAAETCDAFYPSTASGAEGTTLITARIPLEGNLADAVLRHSSGRDDLDAATLACANHIYSKPATKDGTSVEITWTFQVIWRTPDHGHSYLGIARPGGFPTACVKSYPHAAVHHGAEGVTSLAFVIGTDGSVSRLRLTQSSGDKNLDDASLACVAQWRYFPASISGEPTAIDWQANINWRIH